MPAFGRKALRKEMIICSSGVDGVRVGQRWNPIIEGGLRWQLIRISRPTGKRTLRM
jgi:hypothetical protein